MSVLLLVGDHDLNDKCGLTESAHAGKFISGFK